MLDDYRQLASVSCFGYLPFPSYQVPGLMALFKFMTSIPSGMSQGFHLYRQLSIPRALIFSKSDPFHQPSVTEATMHRLCYGDSYFNQFPFRRVVRQMKGELQLRMRSQFGVEIQAERIQQYFCFLFDKTGHNVHTRRAVEISHILKIYIAFMQVYDKHKLIEHPNL